MVVNGATKFGDMAHFDKQLDAFRVRQMFACIVLPARGVGVWRGVRVRRSTLAVIHLRHTSGPASHHPEQAGIARRAG